MTRRPMSFADRDFLIAQASSATQCWLMVSAGLLFSLIASLMPGA